MSERCLAAIARIEAGQPLTGDDIAHLAGSADILTLGMLGDDARRDRHGTDTTFVRVADVELPSGEEAGVAIPPAAGEARIAAPADRFGEVIAFAHRVVEEAGAIPVSAFELSALEAYAEASGRRLPDLLAAVRDTGVSLIADAFLDRLRHAETSLERVRQAGLGLARLSVEHTADTALRLQHITAARALQQSLGWIECFAPLGRSWTPGSPSTGFDDVRQIALARVLIDNIASIQVDWSRYGPKLAQVALTVGADDVDGISPLDDTGQGRRRAPLEEIRRNILAAGLVPVQRDAARRRVSV